MIGADSRPNETCPQGSLPFLAVLIGLYPLVPGPSGPGSHREPCSRRWLP